MIITAIKRVFLDLTIGDFQRKITSETINLLFENKSCGLLHYANMYIIDDFYNWKFDTIAVVNPLRDEDLLKINDIETNPDFFGWTVQAKHQRNNGLTEPRET